VSCSTFSGDPNDALETTSAGGAGVSFDPATNQFVYNWRTPSTKGCYELFVTLNDGTVHRADFNLNK